MTATRRTPVVIPWLCIVAGCLSGVSAVQADDYGVQDAPAPAAPAQPAANPAPLDMGNGPAVAAPADDQDDAAPGPPAPQASGPPTAQVPGVPQAPTTPDQAADAPVRLARFSVVQGDVSWRSDANGDWSPATVNLPIREGAQIWVNAGGRGEIQFDDGSYLRLGGGAVVALQTLYSDTDGEFTELKLSEGLVTLRLLHERSIYQVDTPFVSVKSTGPSRVRIGVHTSEEVAVALGQAQLDGAAGQITLDAGQFVALQGANATYDVRGLPDPDGWEQWNDQLDQSIDNAATMPEHQYLPDNIALCAGNLDAYGTWRHDDQYGEVWCPLETSDDWRPYHDGHWVWVDPFGWTWVGDEPWGWAPYHYGSWIHAGYGWAWVPGPACQFWSPAVVSFCDYDDNVAWCALDPSEIIYPAPFGIGLWGTGWGAFFSIGGCATYYPGDHHHWRPWRSSYVNNPRRFGADTPIVIRGPGGTTGHAFIPVNAGRGGASGTTAAGFGGHGAIAGLPATSTDIFAHGIAPTGRINGAPVAGPANIKPTAISYTPTRTTLDRTAPADIINRPVVRATLPATVETSLHADAGGHAATVPAGGEVMPTKPETSVPGATSSSNDAAARAQAARESLGMHSGSTTSSGGGNPYSYGGATTRSSTANPYSSGGSSSRTGTYGSSTHSTTSYGGYGDYGYGGTSTQHSSSGYRHYSDSGSSHYGSGSSSGYSSHYGSGSSSGYSVHEGSGSSGSSSGGYSGGGSGGGYSGGGSHGGAGATSSGGGGHGGSGSNQNNH